ILVLSITLLSALKQLDLLLGKTCRKLPLEDYVHLLSLVSDSLSDLKRMPPSQLLHLVHLAALLLHEHPSHSLMHIQKFATSCINVFTEHCVFVDGPLKLRLQVLEMVAQHCSDQQAALRSLDTAGIWLLLSKFLAPSQVHDEDTETTIFLKIIAILSSLIRLRRDLVAHALPHLGMILRQLLLCTRGCRPHLGAKQTVMVMNTQPRWISASQPLGAQEAKVLGRLLESLNTKTTVRFLGSSMPEMQKAESLAKPFSKHAAYVLKAYIEAMNDPLCILPLDVRKELQPGIFALCGMVSEYSRDSLMISALDAGGKATLKSLWKEYEKQRYVGRG
ncbi:Urb2/Npa2 family-domain-containing protein, partial [Flammula alnicola]